MCSHTALVCVCHDVRCAESKRSAYTTQAGLNCIMLPCYVAARRVAAETSYLTGWHVVDLVVTRPDGMQTLLSGNIYMHVVSYNT